MGAILDHLMKEHGATMAEAKAALNGWEIRPIENNGVQVGEMIVKENEVHVALDFKHRLKLGRKNILKNTLDPLLKEKGFLVTKLMKNCKYRSQIEKIGFVFTKSDDNYNYFWMNASD